MPTMVSNAAKLRPLDPKDMFQRAYGAKAPVTPIKPPLVLKSTRPALSLEIEYRRILERWIEQMHESVVYWLRASYKANEPEIAIAQDAVPAKELQKAVKRLARRWGRNFDRAAPRLADWFTQKASQRSDAKLKTILRDGGFSVKFKMTKAQRDIIHATVNQNVALIKSIPKQYFTEVEGLVMRSVQTGRDLDGLVKDLLKRYSITRKRAILIARDQNNKATSSLNRARQMELGITKNVWMHSHAGKEPRPTHVAFHGRKFDIRKGLYDKDEGAWVFPGMLINCRCTARPVVEGFE